MQCLCSDGLLRVEGGWESLQLEVAWWPMAVDAFRQWICPLWTCVLPNCSGTPTWVVGLVDVKNLWRSGATLIIVPIPKVCLSLGGCCLQWGLLSAIQWSTNNSWSPSCYHWHCSVTALLPLQPPQHLSLTRPRSGSKLRRTCLSHGCSTVNGPLSHLASFKLPSVLESCSVSRMEERQSSK